MRTDFNFIFISVLRDLLFIIRAFEFRAMECMHVERKVKPTSECHVLNQIEICTVVMLCNKQWTATDFGKNLFQPQLIECHSKCNFFLVFN